MLTLFQRLIAILWLGLVCFETMPLMVYQWATTGESCTACSDHDCACSVGKVPVEACCCAGMFEEEEPQGPILQPVGAFCGDDGGVLPLFRLDPVLPPTPVGSPHPGLQRVDIALCFLPPPLQRMSEPPEKVPIA